MKNIIILICLAASVALAHAQEADSVEAAPAPTPATESSESTAISSSEQDDDDDTNGIRVQLDLDDDLTTDQKFDIAADAISKALGEDFSEELQVEIEGLTDEEKAEIVSSLEEGFVFDIGDNDFPIAALFIAVPAVILFLGMPIFIVLLVLWFGHKKRRQKMELVNVYLEADKEVPPQVLNSFDVGAASSLRRGLLLTALGLGILAAFGSAGDSDVGALGLIPLFVGIARLVYWYVEERDA